MARVDVGDSIVGALATALERTHSDDASTRYAAVLELPTNAESAARIVVLLEDHTEVCVDEGCSAYDVDPTYRPLSGVAFDALCRMREWAWPAIKAGWEAASANARDAMVRALAAQPFQARIRLPDEAHALVVENAAGRPHALSLATWEREFAARVRSGEVGEEGEAFWRAAHDHPNPVERDRSFIRLAEVVTNPEALARELVALLSQKGVWHHYIAEAILRLPPVMPTELLESILRLEIVQTKFPDLWVWVARHGTSSAPRERLIVICFEQLAPGMLGGRRWTSPTTTLERRWRLATEALQELGSLSPDMRATLLDWLATTNESMSIQGSLRQWWCKLLGDDGAEIERELEAKLVAMEQGTDPVGKERARQLRHRFAVMKRGAAS